MNIGINVKGLKKPKIDTREIIDFMENQGVIMEVCVKYCAPRKTGTLENHGIKRAQIPSDFHGEKVYLDTEGIKANHPEERQRKRPDGGNYGYYQEEGWTQHGVNYPGRFYWEKALELVERHNDQGELDNLAEKIIRLK